MTREFDEGLRIVGIGIARFWRCAAGHIAERLQPRRDVGTLCLPRRRRPDVEGTQYRRERTIAFTLASGKIDALAGIGRKVVSLDDRQVDELAAIDDDPGQRRPAAIQHRRHCFEVRRPRRGVAAIGARQQRAPR
jgi:hypothetical protein